MIDVIYDKRGSGKTKRMIQLANSLVGECSGDIVFIDDDNRCVLDLNHDIRYINASEYKVTSPELFYGFLCGVLAQDFDIQVMFLDGFPHMIGLDDAAQIQEFYSSIEKLAKKYNIKMILSVSGPKKTPPEYMKEALI